MESQNTLYIYIYMIFSRFDVTPFLPTKVELGEIGFFPKKMGFNFLFFSTQTKLLSYEIKILHKQSLILGGKIHFHELLQWNKDGIYVFFSFLFMN